MLEAIRDRLASGLTILAQRLTADPRWPQAGRVPYQPRVVAGVTVTPDTAIQVAAVWACLRYLSQTVAVLPWHVKIDGMNGPEIQTKHPVEYLLWKRPSPEWSSFQFRETLTHWALRWGNGYAEVERDQLGRPFALWPVHPERVQVCRDPDTGELYYEVSNSNAIDGYSGGVQISAADMFHIRGFGEGPVGVNVIAYAAQSIGWARAAQLFGSSFFGNGMNPSIAVINKKPLKPEGLKRQKAEFENLYKGPRNANKAMFLDNDADVKAIGIDPQSSQLVETHQYLVEEIARWFGVPPHKIMHLTRSTNNNIEHQSIEVVQDALAPWVKRFEDEAEYKLFGQNRQGLYTNIDMRALMRGDAAARIAYYQGMWNMGAMNANRILSIEGENTIGPDGDVHLVNSAVRTLGWIEEQPVTPPTAPAPTPSPGKTDAADNTSQPDTTTEKSAQDRLQRAALMEFVQ